jgi:hypothetical protein
MVFSWRSTAIVQVFSEAVMILERWQFVKGVE